MVREQDDKAQGRETRQPESPHIVKLVPAEQARVDSSIVEKLELALDRARDGEFDAIAIVGISRDGSNFASYSATSDRLRFIGLLDWIRWRMLQAYEKDD